MKNLQKEKLFEYYQILNHNKNEICGKFYQLN